MSGKIQNDLTGGTFGYWQAVEYLGMNKYRCRCLSCGYEREIDGYFLMREAYPKCEHEKAKKTDLTGMHFGNWEVISEVQRESMKTPDGKKVQRKWLCRCTCGVEREVLQQSLTNGKSTGCGHDTNREFVDLTNKQFGEWTVLKYVGEGKWVCRCSCGKEAIVTRYALITGESKSCGHNTTGFKDLTGQKFGYLKVLKKADLQMVGGETFWTCQCDCGKVFDVGGYRLRSGNTKSCGCKTNEVRKETCLEKYGVKYAPQIGTKRTQEQMAMTENRENLLNVIQHSFDHKPITHELAEFVGLDRTSTMIFLHKYKLEDFVNIGQQNVSRYEEQLNEMYPCNNRSDRKAIGGREIDLYYPEHNFGIEFNGNYWHSEIKKESGYHQEKSIVAMKNNIYLFNIFEYEWNNDDTRKKIISIIDSVLCPDKMIRVMGRKCEVVNISSTEADEFVTKYHLQGKATASINLGLTYNNELIGVMTFGKPRFNDKYQYELIRLAWKDHVSVIGGAAKLFDYFIKTYDPDTIISYCDISKFTGKVYGLLGFENMGLTMPNYKWVNFENKALPRYQTMKQKLIEAGLGTEEETESDIMHRLGYLRMYDSGNLKFVWDKANVRRV